MTASTIRQLYPCSTKGCATMLVAPGGCVRCREEITALDRIAASYAPRSKPRRSSFLWDVMTVAALALLMYILFNLVSVFADWWALGGRPWQ